MGCWFQTNWEMPYGVSRQLLEGFRNLNPPGPKATNTPQCTQAAHDVFTVSSWGRANSTCRQVQAEEAEAQAEAQLPALHAQQSAIRTAAMQD